MAVLTLKVSLVPRWAQLISSNRHHADPYINNKTQLIGWVFVMRDLEYPLPPFPCFSKSEYQRGLIKPIALSWRLFSYLVV